jgi:hypothetical protein
MSRDSGAGDLAGSANSRSIRWRDLSWRRKFAAIAVFLFPFAGAAVVLFFAEKWRTYSGVQGVFPIPAYGDLQQISGVLKHTVRFGERGEDWSLGQLAVDGPGLFGFTCVPAQGDESISCIYPKDPDGETLHNKHATLRYFVMKHIKYPYYDHVIDTPSGSFKISNPETPEAIIMEVDIADGGATRRILSYDDSVARLKHYMATHPAF